MMMYWVVIVVLICVAISVMVHNEIIPRFIFDNLANFVMDKIEPPPTSEKNTKKSPEITEKS